MGNWTSSESGPQISENRVAQIQTETGFTSPQIDRLWKRFQELGVKYLGFSPLVSSKERKIYYFCSVCIFFEGSVFFSIFE